MLLLLLQMLMLMLPLTYSPNFNFHIPTHKIHSTQCEWPTNPLTKR